MVSRRLSENFLTDVVLGFMRSFPPYFLILNPRKSKPSVICVIFVFSRESSRPRSFRKVIMAGCTLVSNISLESAVQMKSSAYLTKRILSPLSATPSTVFSRPSRARFAKVGDAMPPYAKGVIIRSKIALDSI